MRNPIPPASGTTIIGIATGLAIMSSVILRHFGLDTEATLAISGGEAAVWLVLHPQVNRSVPVSDAPPNAPLAVAAAPPQPAAIECSDKP